MLARTWKNWLNRLRKQSTDFRPEPQPLSPRTRRAPRPLLEQLEDRSLPATFTPTDGSTLAAAIATADTNADSSNTILLVPGTYSVSQRLAVASQNNALSSKSLTILDNSPVDPGQVVISAGGTAELFVVFGGATLSIQNATLTGVAATDAYSAQGFGGGAVFNTGGQVALSNVDVTGNSVQGADGNAGAVGQAGQAGQAALGGGIYMSKGSLSLTNCTVKGNSAVGGNGGVGGSGTANADYNGILGLGGKGGAGGAGGAAEGGGIYVGSGSLYLQNTTIQGNTVRGGNGNDGGKAGDGGHNGETQSGSYATGPGGTGGSGGTGGKALGGGLYTAGGDAQLLLTSFSSNAAYGGAAGDGKLGGNGADGVETQAGRGLQGGGPGGGGQGGTGGLAEGGGCYVAAGSVYLTDTSFSADLAQGANGGAAGGSGRAGSGAPGGVGQTGPTSESAKAGLRGGDGGEGGVGGHGGAGGNAFGGGMFQAGGQGDFFGGGFDQCRAAAGNGTDGGVAGVAGNGGTGGQGGDGTASSHFAGGGGTGGNAGLGGEGGYGGVGGAAAGGGVYVANGSLSLFDLSIASNSALGGKGGNGATGAPAGMPGVGGPGGGGGPSTGFDGNGGEGGDGAAGGPGGGGGAGGSGQGGGCFITGGNLTLVGASIASNQAQGGSGGNGGTPSANGQSGAEGGTATNGIGGEGGFGGDGGNGGAGGNGGNGYGGGICQLGGSVSLYGGSFDASNAAIGGIGGTGNNASPATAGGRGGDTSSQFSEGGYGGNGGFGGNGGNGGAGGNGEGGGVYVALSHEIVIIGVSPSGTVQAGTGGAAGTGSSGGAGGDAGDPLGGQSPSKPGSNGNPGKTGDAGTASGSGVSGSQTATSTAGSANALVVSALPQSVFAGSALPVPVFVIAEDSNGNVVPSFNSSVTLGGTSGTRLVLDGTLTATAENGLAEFSSVTVVQSTSSQAALAGTGGSVASIASPSFSVIGFTPAQIRTAYGLSGMATTAAGKPKLDGTGQTIAIVDALDDPNMDRDLDAFDSQFGLTEPGPSLYSLYGTASSFLTVLNQQGQPSPLPAVDTTGVWEGETILDLEWAHAMAPGARIILIEATGGPNETQNLIAAAQEAGTLQDDGVSVVSMSFGFDEVQPPAGYPLAVIQNEAQNDAGFLTSGVTYLASSGDYGALDASYPAFSPNVVAVGGTTLMLNPDGTINTESGWGYTTTTTNQLNGSGGGVSVVEARPVYQDGVQTNAYRTIPDLSFFGDPHTGAAVYNSFNPDGGSVWSNSGGTSLSCPCIAGLIAVVDQGRAEAGDQPLSSAQTHEALYSLPAVDFDKPSLAPVTGGGGVSSVTVRTGSSGFPASTQVPVTFSDPDGTGTTARGVATTNANGEIVSVIVTYTGNGYTDQPTITFTGGGADPNYRVTLGSVNQNYTSNAGVVDPGNYNEVTGLGSPVAGSLVPGMIAWTPVVLSKTQLPKGGTGQSYTQSITATGGNDDISVTYSVISGTIPAGLTFKPSGSELNITGKPTAAGTVTFSVTATDSVGSTDTESYTLTIGSGAFPTVTKVGPATGPTGGGTRVTITGKNLGGPSTATVDFGPNNPGTIVSDSGSSIVAIAPAGAAGTVDVTVTVAGTTSLSSAADHFGYTAKLVFQPASLPVGTAGQAYTGTVSVTGGSGSYVYTLAPGSRLPAFVTLGTDGALRGTTLTAGAYSITVVATDTHTSTLTAKMTYSLHVDPALTVSPATLSAATVGDAYRSQLKAAGGSGKGYVYGSADLPAWLHLSSTGILTGTPAPSDTSPATFTIAVTDSVQAAGSGTVELTIDPALTASTATAPVATAGDKFTTKLVAAGGSGKGYAFKATGLPKWLTLSGSGLLSGTPTSTTGSPVAFTVTITDGIKATGTVNETLTVDPAVTLSPGTLAVATVGDPFSTNFSATGGSGSQYTFTATGLPSWLTLSPSGLLTGTPPSTSAPKFTVTVTDGNGGALSLPYTLKIDAALTISPNPLQTATVGDAFSTQLKASGGSGKGYVFSSTDLPAWLHLSSTGLLTGTTASSDTSPATFTITVTDSILATGVRNYQLTVDPAVTATPATLPDAVVGEKFSTQLVPAGGSGKGYAFKATGLPKWLTLSSSGLLSGTPTSVTGSPIQFTVTITDGTKATGSISFSLMIDPA